MAAWLTAWLLRWLLLALCLLQDDGLLQPTAANCGTSHSCQTHPSGTSSDASKQEGHQGSQQVEAAAGHEVRTEAGARHAMPCGDRFLAPLFGNRMTVEDRGVGSELEAVEDAVVVVHAVLGVVLCAFPIGDPALCQHFCKSFCALVSLAILYSTTCFLRRDITKKGGSPRTCCSLAGRSCHWRWHNTWHPARPAERHLQPTNRRACIRCASGLLLCGRLWVILSDCRSHLLTGSNATATRLSTAGGCCIVLLLASSLWDHTTRPYRAHRPQLCVLMFTKQGFASPWVWIFSGSTAHVLH